MKTLTDEAVTVDTDAEDEVDKLMAQYKKPMQVSVDTENAPEIKSTSEQPQPEKAQPVAESVWRARPDLYFQKGAKKGTLKPGATNPEPKQEMELSGTLIDGAMFIMLVDMLFPLLITFVNNSVSKYEIKLEDLQLSEKQKKDLTPISDEVVKYLTLKANPVWLMVIAMAGIYGINYMAAYQAAKSNWEVENKKTKKE